MRGSFGGRGSPVGLVRIGVWSGGCTKGVKELLEYICFAEWVLGGEMCLNLAEERGRVYRGTNDGRDGVGFRTDTHHFCWRFLTLGLATL